MRESFVNGIRSAKPQNMLENVFLVHRGRYLNRKEAVLTFTKPVPAHVENNTT